MTVVARFCTSKQLKSTLLDIFFLRSSCSFSAAPIENKFKNFDFSLWWGKQCGFSKLHFLNFHSTLHCYIFASLPLLLYNCVCHRGCFRLLLHMTLYIKEVHLRIGSPLSHSSSSTSFNQIFSFVKLKTKTGTFFFNASTYFTFCSQGQGIIGTNNNINNDVW